MKAITIRQPWASLIALGQKHYETRSWKTNYRGQLAIHAGLTIEKGACLDPYIKSILYKCGLSQHNLPTGRILAICRLNDCYKVTAESDEHILAESDSHFLSIDPEEAFLGDLSKGRYAWELDDMQALLKPIEAKGKQSLWDCSCIFDSYNCSTN